MSGAFGPPVSYRYGGGIRTTLPRTDLCRKNRRGGLWKGDSTASVPGSLGDVSIYNLVLRSSERK